MRTRHLLQEDMILTLVYLVGLLLSNGVESCPCSPDPNDQSSRITCNNMGSYSTGMRGKSVAQCHPVTIRDFSGIQICEVAPYNSQNDQPIFHSQGSNYVYYQIYQPGYFNEECYNDSLFCAYNVQCASDQILYYHFSAHDIENPTQSSSSSCLDILSINRQSFPNQQLSSCGRVGINGATYETYNVMQDGYDISSMSATFRSNMKCSATGYFLWASCVSNGDADHVSILSYKSIHKGIIKVPFKGKLIYARSVLIVKDSKGKTLFIAKNICLLKVRNADSRKVFTFKNSPKARKFSGEGKLNVRYYCRYYYGYRKYCVAYYKFIGVPFELRLNETERRSVDMLLKGSINRFNRKNDYRVTPRNSTLMTESWNYGRKWIKYPSTVLPPKRHVNTKRNEDTNFKALAYELSRSSKEIVRTVGQFYLQEVY